jgi:hypothetical protein
VKERFAGLTVSVVTGAAVTVSETGIAFGLLEAPVELIVTFAL